MRTVSRKLTAGALLLALALVAGACGEETADTTTTAAEATTTTSDGGGGETTTTAGEATTTTVAGPITDVPVTVGFASADQPAYAPATLGIENAERVPMEAIFFQQSELSLQALLQGEVDVLAIGVNGPMIAVNEGAELVIIGVTIGNDWTLVTTSDIETPADLAGTTIAIHSETSTGTPLVRGTLDDAGVEAEFVIIPGSPNRAQAMTQGQIDATPLFLSGAIELEIADPDRFRVLLDYGEVPFASQAIVTTRSWLEENPEVAQALVEHFIQIGRRITAEPQWAVDQLSDRFPDDDPAYLDRLVAEYVDRGLWVTDGGAELLSNFGGAIEINIALGTLPADALTEVEDYVDRTALDMALANLE
jgi:ABC-type nitrate/sulfonate/bicarbonate transport system substrate-binding protein